MGDVKVIALQAPIVCAIEAAAGSASAMVVGPFGCRRGGTQGTLDFLPLRRPRSDAEPNESIVFTIPSAGLTVMGMALPTQTGRFNGTSISTPSPGGDPRFVGGDRQPIRWGGSFAKGGLGCPPRPRPVARARRRPKDPISHLHVKDLERGRRRISPATGPILPGAWGR